VARGLDFRCRIVGGGPLEATLRERIAASGLTGVVSLPGPLPQRDVIAAMWGAAAFAAPCVVGGNGDRDGMPTVLLEAMALGTPCVATPVTGIPEAIRHEETGLLVPEASPHALADALQRLLEDRTCGCGSPPTRAGAWRRSSTWPATPPALRSIFRRDPLPLAS
jgi:colanic acid/amylovoran biosynthesis glycosyltransferase